MIQDIILFVQQIANQVPGLAPLLAFLLAFIEAVLPSLPLTVIVAFNISMLSALSGPTIGTIEAILFSAIGSFLGMILIFYLIRTYLRPHFEKKVAGHVFGEKFLEIVHGRTTWIIWLFLANPLLPSAIMNIVLSLTKVKASKYLFLTITSRFVVIFLLVFLGSVFNIQNNPENILWMLLFYSLIFGLFWIKYRKKPSNSSEK